MFCRRSRDNVWDWVDHYEVTGGHLGGLLKQFGKSRPVFGWPWGVFGEVLRLIREALGMSFETSGTIFDVTEQETRFSRNLGIPYVFKLIWGLEVSLLEPGR